MTNGKNNNQLEFNLFNKEVSFNELFLKQLNNQLVLLKSGKYDEFKSTENCTSIPVDDVKLASYHIQQLMSEIGEVLDADKRWKNFRNNKYDLESKKEELADCFIVLMNIVMFSGISGEEMANAISNKLDVVSERINKEIK